MKYATFILAAVMVSGCAGVKTKTELVGGQRAQVTSQPGPVCLLAGGLPQGVSYTIIGRVKATKRTYGGVDSLMKPMADEARRVGADAITYLQADQRFKSPMPWRINAPTGDGQAVKISLPFDCAQAGGQLL